MKRLPSAATSSEAWKGYALAALAATAWATGGLTAKWLFVSLDVTTAAWPFPPPGLEVAPTVLAGARAWVSALLIIFYLALRRPGELKVHRSDIPFLAVFGVVGLAGVHVAYFLAISYTNVATAILLEYLAPVLTLIFGVAFLGERPTWVLPTGVVLSITGCALVVGVASGEGITISSLGLAWGLAAAGFFAGYSLMGRYGATRYSPWTLLAYGLGFASLFWVLYLGGFGSMMSLLADPTGLAAVAYLAVVSTLIPFGAFLKALHYIDATKALITSTMEPVLAGVLAFPLLAEVFDGWQVFGGALVVSAIVLVQRRSPSPRTVPPTP